jgi:hypothetical protein
MTDHFKIASQLLFMLFQFSGSWTIPAGLEAGTRGIEQAFATHPRCSEQPTLDMEKEKEEAVPRASSGSPKTVSR